MTRFLAPAFALCLAAAAAQAAPAGPQVLNAWSRPAVAGATGVGFMTLRNPGAGADALVAVESPLARKVEIHETSMTGGVAAMRRLDRAPLPPGGTVTFAPGGAHLMFLGLSRALKTGDTLPATLTFASGAKVEARFSVRLAPPGAGHAGH